MTIEEQRGVFISRADLWEKLIERKKENIDNEANYLVNLGINQAIGIMNSMQGFTYNPKEMEGNDGKRSTTKSNQGVQEKS